MIDIKAWLYRRILRKESLACLSLALSSLCNNLGWYFSCSSSDGTPQLGKIPKALLSPSRSSQGCRGNAHPSQLAPVPAWWPSLPPNYLSNAWLWNDIGSPCRFPDGSKSSDHVDAWKYKEQLCKRSITVIANHLRVKENPDHLSVTGLSRTDRIVGRIFRETTGIAWFYLLDSLEALENSLYAPEAASSDYGLTKHGCV